MNKRFMVILSILLLNLIFVGCSSVNEKHSDLNNIETNEKMADDSDLLIKGLEEKEDNTPTQTIEETYNDNIITVTNDEDYIDAIVNDYNLVAPNKFDYYEDFDVQDKSGVHYRTEFRLSAFNNSIGKSYSFCGKTVDIVAYKTISGKQIVRIYANYLSLDQSIEIIQYVSQLLDSAITEDVIEDAINKINEEKEANGYYYGKLGLTLLGNETKGYDLMIAAD